jgi:hypothetical protein
MTDFTESIAFLSIVKIFICRYSPWQIRIFAIHPRFPSPLLILLLFPVNINEWRVLQVSLVLRFKFKTDLIINWIYPIKTHSRETWGKSSLSAWYFWPIIYSVVWPCKGQKWFARSNFTYTWVWRHPGHRSFLLANYCAMYASASKTWHLEKFKINIYTCRIQTKFCTQKRLNTKSILHI